jgi:hypothetical protein
MKGLRALWSLTVASSLILTLAAAPTLAGMQSSLDKPTKQEQTKKSATNSERQKMTEHELMERSQSFFDSQKTIMSKGERKRYEAAVLAEIERQNEDASLSF